MIDAIVDHDRSQGSGWRRRCSSSARSVSGDGPHRDDISPSVEVVRGIVAMWALALVDASVDMLHRRRSPPFQAYINVVVV